MEFRIALPILFLTACALVNVFCLTNEETHALMKEYATESEFDESAFNANDDEESEMEVNPDIDSDVEDVRMQVSAKMETPKGLGWWIPHVIRYVIPRRRSIGTLRGRASQRTANTQDDAALDVPDMDDTEATDDTDLEPDIQALLKTLDETDKTQRTVRGSRNFGAHKGLGWFDTHHHVVHHHYGRRRRTATSIGRTWHRLTKTLDDAALDVPDMDDTEAIDDTDLEPDIQALLKTLDETDKTQRTVRGSRNFGAHKGLGWFDTHHHVVHHHYGRRRRTATSIGRTWHRLTKTLDDAALDVPDMDDTEAIDDTDLEPDIQALLKTLDETDKTQRTVRGSRNFGAHKGLGWFDTHHNVVHHHYGRRRRTATSIGRTWHRLTKTLDDAALDVPDMDDTEAIDDTDLEPDIQAFLKTLDETDKTQRTVRGSRNFGAHKGLGWFDTHHHVVHHHYGRRRRTATSIGRTWHRLTKTLDDAALDVPDMDDTEAIDDTDLEPDIQALLKTLDETDKTQRTVRGSRNFGAHKGLGWFDTHHHVVHHHYGRRRRTATSIGRTWHRLTKTLDDAALDVPDMDDTEAIDDTDLEPDIQALLKTLDETDKTQRTVRVSRNSGAHKGLGWWDTHHNVVHHHYGRRRRTATSIGRTWNGLTNTLGNTCLSERMSNTLSKVFGFPINVCVNVAYMQYAEGLQLTFTNNGRQVFQSKMTLRSPEPVCYGLPDVKACVKVSKVEPSLRNICLQLAVSNKNGVNGVRYASELGCFQIPTKGRHESARMTGLLGDLQASIETIDPVSLSDFQDSNKPIWVKNAEEFEEPEVDEESRKFPNDPEE